MHGQTPNQVVPLLLPQPVSQLRAGCRRLREAARGPSPTARELLTVPAGRKDLHLPGLYIRTDIRPTVAETISRRCGWQRRWVRGAARSGGGDAGGAQADACGHGAVARAALTRCENFRGVAGRRRWKRRGGIEAPIERFGCFRAVAPAAMSWRVNAGGRRCPGSGSVQRAAHPARGSAST